MVFNFPALLVGVIIGIAVAGLVNAWEDRLVMRNKGWIVTVSILGALAVICIAAFAVASIPSKYDNLVQVFVAAFLTFVPLRRVKILKTIFLGWGTRKEAADDQKEDV